MKICVTCDRCSGKGIIFSPELTATAEALSTHGPMAASEVHAKLGGEKTGVRVTAINNRLVRLVELGVATVARKNGKVKLYLRTRTGRGANRPMNLLAQS